MKKFGFFIFLFFGFSMVLLALPPADEGQFEKAAIAYRDGKFDESAALYKALTEKYPESPVFQYNLGNALHRKGEMGPAILAFERARYLAPRRSDILYNLNYVKSFIEYRIEDKRNELIKIAEKVLGYFTFDELFIALLALGLLFFASWSWVLFLKQDTSWGFFRKVLLLITLLFVALVTVKSIQINFFRESIIIAKQVQVYYGPSVTDQPAFQLGEGVKVYCVDEREGWSRILIASGESGWVQEDSMMEIRPKGMR